MTGFPDRAAAGRALADTLTDHAYPDPVVLALPRGGVPVAAPIARALHAPLDLVMAHKVGVPGQPEVAAGAVVNGDDPLLVVNPDVLAAAGMSDADIQPLAAAELAEIRRRRDRYLGSRPAVPLEGRTAIVVDDGVATGATTRAALQAVRRRKPGLLVLAVPVAPPQTLAALQDEADEIVCPLRPPHFMAVGEFYDDFRQVSDAEVIALLG